MVARPRTPTLGERIEWPGELTCGLPGRLLVQETFAKSVGGDICRLGYLVQNSGVVSSPFWARRPHGGDRR